MSGLSYRKFSDHMSEALSRRKGFKPDSTFSADPIPANNPQVMPVDYKYRPGHYAPDPKPARPASTTYDIPSFNALDVECDDSYAGPDPIPAESYWSDL